MRIYVNMARSWDFIYICCSYRDRVFKFLLCPHFFLPPILTLSFYKYSSSERINHIDLVGFSTVIHCDYTRILLMGWKSMCVCLG